MAVPANVVAKNLRRVQRSIVDLLERNSGDAVRTLVQIVEEVK
jgi:hypothetical protein